MLSGEAVIIRVDTLFSRSAKLADLPVNVDRARELAGEGRHLYRSPASGDLVIFDNDPFRFREARRWRDVCCGRGWGLILTLATRCGKIGDAE